MDYTDVLYYGYGQDGLPKQSFRHGACSCCQDNEAAFEGGGLCECCTEDDRKARKCYHCAEVMDSIEQISVIDGVQTCDYCREHPEG